MGVKDLSTVINRSAPSSVTFHSNLSSFAGKTLAIDANLMTSKFHYGRTAYAPTRYSIDTNEQDQDLISNQHCIASWYALLSTLSRLGIKPVVVFDGNTRLAAKAAENLRRRQSRAKEKSRASAEVERNDRLEELSAVWTSLEASKNKDDVLKRYRDLVTIQTEEESLVSRAITSDGTTPTLMGVETGETVSGHSSTIVPESREELSESREEPIVVQQVRSKSVPLEDVESESMVQALIKLKNESTRDDSNALYSPTQKVIGVAVSSIFASLGLAGVVAGTAGVAATGFAATGIAATRVAATGVVAGTAGVLATGVAAAGVAVTGVALSPILAAVGLGLVVSVSPIFAALRQLPTGATIEAEGNVVGTTEAIRVVLDTSSRLADTLTLRSSAIPFQTLSDVFVSLLRFCFDLILAGT
jgi:hypothetical protein